MSVNPPSPESPAPEGFPETTPLDRAALVERLFREHNDALIRFLQVRLRSRQEATEVAQEAYVRLLSLDEPGAVSYLRAFLFKTAANLAVDRIRRGQVHLRATDQSHFRNFKDSRTPERHAAGEQTLARMGRLVAAMPPKCRHAFVLHRFHGRDIASIAREMNIAERTVRAYVERALLQCRAALDLEQGNE
jgi:RNA polymerase sigma-70 factor (ECF subfamily)